MEVSFKFDLLILTFDCSTPSGCWQLFCILFMCVWVDFCWLLYTPGVFFVDMGKEGLALLLTTPASVICFNSLMRGQAFFCFL